MQSTNKSYKSPSAISPPHSDSLYLTRFVVTVLACLFGTTSAIGLAGSFYAPLNEFLMPRFGWAGLFLYSLPVLFLVRWLRFPHQQSLRSSATMSMMLAAILAVELFSKGTTSSVSNPFHDRLHSSWILCVLPPLILAFIIFALDKRLTRKRDS